MRWGIIADIHANYEALEAVLCALAKERIDKYVCLGDIVGYGANPNECIAEVQKLNPLTIAGNHDWASVKLFDTTYFNPHAKSAVFWTAHELSSADKEFLKKLKLIDREEQLTAVHGSLDNPEQFKYIGDLASAERTFELLQTKICFIGHTHRPAIFIKQDENCMYSYENRIKLQAGREYIVNAGSVGQPRDGNPRAAYVVYDSNKEELEIKRVAYDFQRTQDKIVQAGLPIILAERLAVGR